MNSHPDPHDENQLWQDLVDDVAPDGFRDALLHQTVTHAHRRRRNRRLFAGAATIGAVAAALLLVSQRNDSGHLASISPPTAPRDHETQGRKAVSAPDSTQGNVVPGTHIRLVNDEELAALFPGRPLALIGPPGEQQLVFLDQTEPH